MKTDISIIGAGPAGLMAAISSARAGAKTTIVEVNTIAGRKLLRTGRTRCNLSHTGSVDDFVKTCRPFGEFLRDSLDQFSPDDLREYFARHKLKTKVEKDGCVFPITNRATDVVRVLVDDARKLSVRFLYGRRAQSIKKDAGEFVLQANSEKIAALAVIIATGGVTWPFTGSTGDGYKLARFFDHTIVEPKACLAALVTAESWPGELAGVGVKNVVITATAGNRKLCTTGPMMFTNDGIDGPAVFDLSRLITDFLPNPEEPIKVSIDMMPEYQSGEIDRQINSLCASNPRKELAGVLARFLPRALMLHLTGRLTPSATILAGQLTTSQRRQLVNLLKKLPLSITATGPIARATITRGGISTDEIDPKTMESKLCSGLFFAGEVINVDGPCGGFNLQIAFSTGYLAGKTTAEHALQEKGQK